MFALSLLLVALLWELYKWIGPQDGGTLFGLTILPRANDTAMPHVWEMLSRYARARAARRRRVDRPRGPVRCVVLVPARAHRLRDGGVVGIGLAVLMARYKVVERGLLPYLVISQTIPLIALAPLVVSWGGKLHIGGFEWPRWLSASVLGRVPGVLPGGGGHAARAHVRAAAASLELMDSYAASWRQTLFKLRFPAAVPFMIPALKLGATASVIGVVVAEISTGLAGGVGRLIIEYAREATSDPAKVFTAVFAAAAARARDGRRWSR